MYCLPISTSNSKTESDCMIAKEFLKVIKIIIGVSAFIILLQLDDLLPQVQNALHEDRGIKLPDIYYENKRPFLHYNGLNLCLLNVLYYRDLSIC